MYKFRRLGVKITKKKNRNCPIHQSNIKFGYNFNKLATKLDIKHKENKIK